MTISEAIKHLQRLKILNKILHFLQNKLEEIFCLIITSIFFALIGGVLFVLFFLINSCIDHTEKEREESISFMLADPRTLNDEKPVWITIPYKRGAYLINGYVTFELDGKSYTTKNFIKIERKR